LLLGAERRRAKTNGAPEQLKPEEAERQGRLAQWCAASLQAAKGGRGRSTRERRERNGGAAEEKGIGLGFDGTDAEVVIRMRRSTDDRPVDRHGDVEKPLPCRTGRKRHGC
jgi:hypothetical protein